MKFRIIISLLLVWTFFLDEESVNAVTAELEKIDAETQVLVIFSSEDEKVGEQQRLLDMSLGHFSNNIIFKHTEEVEQDDLDGVTHLFYYGETEEEVSSDIPDIISSFDGPVVAIGHNIEQLGDTYSFVETNGEETIAELDYLGEEDKSRTVEPQLVMETEVDEESEVLVQGSDGNSELPVIMEKEDVYYIAVDRFYEPFSVYISQFLNTVFDVETTDKTPAYLRIEDVHPMVNPEYLMEIAEELKEREIPYMIAVIPVYLHPETGEEISFDQHPEVLDALKYMQDNGGSVLLHGYTHQFRMSETGEGFEFWDVENDMPIYHGPEEDVEKLTEEDFDNAEDYEMYMEENKDYERDYIEQRLTRGVQELSNYGLYPLGFEPPHYTISQHGYEVVSEYFSTFVGQAQLSDENWEIMNTTPYANGASFLNGMIMLPETVGYVQPDNDNAVEDMMEKADLYQVTDGGMIGGFYHSYLGVDRLIELVEAFEEIPNKEWIDLKELDNEVEVENVTITSGDGEIDADINQFSLMTTSIDYPAYHARNFAENTAWAMVWIGALSVLLLISFTIFQKVKSKRQERSKKNG